MTLEWGAVTLSPRHGEVVSLGVPNTSRSPQTVNIYIDDVMSYTENIIEYGLLWDGMSVYFHVW